jgi:hypothetical protein
LSNNAENDPRKARAAEATADIGARGRAIASGDGTSPAATARFSAAVWQPCTPARLRHIAKLTN